MYVLSLSLQFFEEDDMPIILPCTGGSITLYPAEIAILVIFGLQFIVSFVSMTVHRAFTMLAALKKRGTCCIRQEKKDAKRKYSHAHY